MTAQGKLFAPDGCGHEAQGAAVPPPGFTTSQGRMGRLLRKETGPTRHPRRTASSACPSMRARSTTSKECANDPAASCGGMLEAWCGSSIARLGGVSVNRRS
ncbi:hypothetical protein B9473_000300 [Klebsiella quasipneumoniae subsp. quasipneumoniae]|nr:hypothetical protein B9473_000300 [Klebsiella quasipneumoniae subsp. quasipneumoniae]